MIRMIACIGKDRELGKNNELVFKFKEDMDFFKKMTLNQTVVMGRKTFESIGHTLPDRKNIILSRESEYSFDDILALDEDVWIIGGESLYYQFLPYAKELYLTEVDKSVEADAFFPIFDETQYSVEVIKECEENGTKFVIKRYLLLSENEL